MENEDSVFPFRNVPHALAYFQHNNPARQKFIDLFESSGTNKPQDFSGYSEADRWASVCHAVKRVRVGASREERHIFDCYFFGASAIAQLAQELSLGKSTAYRILDRVTEALEKELERRELIPPCQEERKPK